MLEWHFKRLDADYPDDAALAMKNFRRESTELPELFVRELFQNVLDARVESDRGTARVTIRMAERGTGLIRSVLEKIVKPLEPHLAASDHKEPREYDHPRALVVEEFGTKGLTGKVDDSRARGEAERWANFWHGEGKRSKGGRSLGRAGQGKITYHMASAAQALLANSVRVSGEPKDVVFGKCIVQKSHEVGQNHYMRHGYWCRPLSDENRQPLPESDANFISNFRKEFGLARTPADPGTSWIIPYPVPSITKEALLSSVLKGFHFSILKGALDLEIFNQKIDRSNVASLITKHVSPNIISSAFVAFLQQVASRSIKPFELGKEWKFTGEILDEASFNESDLTKLREMFDAGEIIAVRFPLTLTKKNGATVDTFFDAYVCRKDGLDRTEEIYIRSDLAIADEKWLRDVPGKTLGAVIADDDAISEFLGYAEEASHLKWTAAEDELLGRYDRSASKDAISKVRRSLPRLCRLLAGNAAGIDEDALAHILSVPAPEGSRKKRLTAGSKKQKAVVPPPPPPDPKPNPKPFTFADVDLGVRIRPGDLKLQPGQTATIRFAYARVVGEGDPFARYHPFDFDLADEKAISIETKGVEVAEREANQLKISVGSPDFQITVTGFAKDQRLVCRSATEAAGG